jgi:hypothetical protein
VERFAKPALKRNQGSMHEASILSFTQSADALKEKYRRWLSNVFLDADKLRQLLENRHCLLHSSEASLFLLIPYHDFYYNFLYVSANKEALCKDLKSFLQDYDHSFTLRASITGKEPPTGEVATIFEESGFALAKRLARVRADSESSFVKQLLKDQPKERVEYANAGDAEEISEMLFEEFDLYGDNIPETSEIIENIEARQVLVIRKNKRIGALHYFSIQNGQYFGIYDITRKAYRDEFLSLKFGHFLHHHIRRLAVRLTRVYSWRDTANKRLMAYAQQCKQTPDGVFIYNMVYKPSKPEGYSIDSDQSVETTGRNSART